eukprot:TRINITY_DN87902_c0_g1_i1.p1 TRINITY_DN87902_c0_g1~~TRINITY_DN87902_c0_g1_i1.p1  ORF type:complete len:351 (-),score=74.71 TRINITY_DN87902_c0_g1_i1:48-1049(-)
MSEVKAKTLDPEAGREEFRLLRAKASEQWLRHFCQEDREYRELLIWIDQEGFSRPEGFEARIAHADMMREKGSAWHKKGDYRRALHLFLGAVHALDFTANEQEHDLTQEQRLQMARSMLPVLTNLSMTFLCRGDHYHAVKAASLGLKPADKLPAEEAAVFRAKLLYRRGLARGEKGPEHSFEDARSDLLEAAKLMPQDKEIRSCLERCTEFVKKEKREYREKFHAKWEKANGKAKTDSAPAKPQDLRKYTSDYSRFAEVHDSGDDEASDDAAGSHEAKTRLEEEVKQEVKLGPAAETFCYVVGTSLRQVRLCYLRLRRVRLCCRRLKPHGKSE